MILENGHPTSYLNQLIANRIKDFVLENQALHNYDISKYENSALQNNDWLKLISQKAFEQSKPMSEVLYGEAEYVLRDKIRSENILPNKNYFLSYIKTNLGKKPLKKKQKQLSYPLLNKQNGKLNTW
jgi:hypothetical protein